MTVLHQAAEVYAGGDDRKHALSPLRMLVLTEAFASTRPHGKFQLAYMLHDAPAWRSAPSELAGMGLVEVRVDSLGRTCVRITEDGQRWMQRALDPASSVEDKLDRVLRAVEPDPSFTMFFEEPMAFDRSDLDRMLGFEPTTKGEPVAHPASVDPIWRHVATGGVYVEVARCMALGGTVCDMSAARLVVNGDGECWVLPREWVLGVGQTEVAQMTWQTAKVLRLSSDPGTPVVVYARIDERSGVPFQLQHWVRTVEEFEDGRFVRVQS